MHTNFYFIECISYYTTTFSYYSYWNISNIDTNRPFRDIALKLFIQANDDSRILLSSAALNPAGNVSAPHYEIVLGSDNNKRYEIYRGNQRLERKSQTNILDPKKRISVDISINTSKFFIFDISIQYIQ